MCKRKIFIAEAFFALLLFAALVIFSPLDASAAVKVTTKGTTSSIKDPDGVIEDDLSDIDFPINIKNDNYVKRVYKITIRLSFYSPEGILPKSTTLSIDGIDVIKVKTPEYSPAVYKETFFTYDDSLDDGTLEFDFGNQEFDTPIECDYEIHIQQAVPEITLNPYLTQSIRAGSTSKVTVQITDPYKSKVSSSSLKASSSNSSVLKVDKITQDSSNSKKFTVTLKGVKAGSATITFTYPKAKSQTLKGRVTAPPKPVATFRSSKTTLYAGCKVSMRSLINLKGGTSLTIKNAKSSKPSVLAVSGSYLVPKKKGTAVVTANLNGVNRKITITVVPLASTPTTKTLKTSLSGIKYESNTMKTYYTLKFTNTSSRTITTAKVRILTGKGIYDQMNWTKTLTLNLKPGATVTRTYYIQKMVQAPSKTDISIKCLKVSWKK